MTPAELKALIRTVPDFPEPGIQFRDISTLIGNGPGLASAVTQLSDIVRETGAQKIAGVEARGFIFGAAVAVQLGIGFIPVRKPGKLPVETISIAYDLEYGRDRLEIDPTGIGNSEQVAIVDDLLATGGTALAATQLLRRSGAQVKHAFFVIDLPDLGGAQKLQNDGVVSQALMAFAGA